MSEHRDWQRETAIRWIEAAMRQSPAPPLARLFAEAAAYVGASPAEVEAWWSGRAR